MGSLRQIIAAAGVTVALLAATASAASAAGTLTVGITGAGNVSATGIDCTRSIGGALSGTCSNSYADVRVCEPGPIKPICFNEPPTVTVAAAKPAAGFVFDSWTGACARQDATCTVEMDGDAGTVANYVDNTDPGVTLGAVASTLRGSVTFTAGASDNAGVARVEFTLAGKKVSDDTAPYSVTVNTNDITDGPGTVVATAFDTSGRSKSASADVTIDNTAPSVAVGGPNGAVFGPGSTQSWTIAASDKLSGVALVRCSVVAAGAAASFGACSGVAVSHAVTGKPGGSYVFTVRATDGAGNVTDVTRGFAIDATPPVTTIGSGIGDGDTTSDTSLTWGLSASEAGVAFACRVYPAALTPGSFAPCSAADTHTASGFSPGTYTFEVRASDAVGNVEANPVKRTFTVVTPPPPAPVAAPVTVAPAGAAGTGAAQLSGAKNQPAPQLLVTLAFSFANSTTKQTKLTTLVVKNVPAGSTVTALCPKSCGKKGFKKTNASGQVSLATLIKKPLKVNTLITVVVSRPGSSSAVKVLKVRPHKAPLVITQCQPEAAAKPAAC